MLHKLNNEIKIFVVRDLKNYVSVKNIAKKYNIHYDDIINWRRGSQFKQYSNYCDNKSNLMEEFENRKKIPIIPEWLLLEIEQSLIPPPLPVSLPPVEEVPDNEEEEKRKIALEKKWAEIRKKREEATDVDTENPDWGREIIIDDVIRNYLRPLMCTDIMNTVMRYLPRNLIYIDNNNRMEEASNILTVEEYLQMKYKGLRRIYLNIPYEDKEWFKKVGGKWDPKCKSWYLPKDGKRTAQSYYNILTSDYQMRGAPLSTIGRQAGYMKDPSSNTREYIYNNRRRE